MSETIKSDFKIEDFSSEEKAAIWSAGETVFRVREMIAEADRRMKTIAHSSGKVLTQAAQVAYIPNKKDQLELI